MSEKESWGHSVFSPKTGKVQLPTSMSDWKVVSQGNPKQEGQWKRWLRKFLIMISEYHSSLIMASHPRFNRLNLSISLAARYEIFRKYGPRQTKECLQTRSTWQSESTRDRLHPPVGSVVKDMTHFPFFFMPVFTHIRSISEVWIGSAKILFSFSLRGWNDFKHQQTVLEIL